ncbi:VOC family protein [Streptomyces kanamyceticus]|uniref:VOC family protein n=1 Tax=Streptomyces kanamyceticus TaxID=1967 RepID=A0A5J6GJF6_STRKN|nr:VOC family protein [Streptomyces kanamyceticus]QEU93948.1 VOC family protein [Streptomyces kanamyceticus]
MTIAKLRAVALDCRDHLALAEFYAAIIGGTPVRDEADADWIELTGHEGTTLAFQESPGHVPPTWPSDDGSQQLHLDLTVDDLDVAEKQVLALGATVLDATDRDRSWRVYADPAGHPFCLCAD